MKKALIIFAALGLIFIPMVYALTQIVSHKQPFNLNLPMTKKAYNLKGGSKPASTTAKVITSKYSTTPSFKGIYMNKEDEDHLIIGDLTRENRMVDFLTTHHFNHVYMYDLSTTLSTSQGRQNCAAFIERLSGLGIKVVGTGGSINSLSDLSASASRAKYNNQMTGEARPAAKFSGLNLEREAWRYPKTGTTTWDDWQAITKSCLNYTNPAGITMDGYIGQLNDKQGLKTEAQLASFIVANYKRFLVSCYLSSDKAIQKNALFNIMLSRLNALGLAAINRTPKGKPVQRLDVIVIFSASDGHLNEETNVIEEIHMHDYFLTHTLEDAYASFINSANSIDWPGKNGINFIGVQGYGLQEFYSVWP